MAYSKQVWIEEWSNVEITLEDVLKFIERADESDKDEIKEALEGRVEVVSAGPNQMKIELITQK